uniref:Putative secreted protein n=1 Tax=Anopheles marajoara TaxID=58244 RepID=A0A2M4CCI4_9DIPT
MGYFLNPIQIVILNVLRHLSSFTIASPPGLWLDLLREWLEIGLFLFRSAFLYVLFRFSTWRTPGADGAHTWSLFRFDAVGG